MDAGDVHVELSAVAEDGFFEFEDFAFDALEVLEGDVAEIAGAAGGIEDAEVGEAFLKRDERLDGGGAEFLFVGDSAEAAFRVRRRNVYPLAEFIGGHDGDGGGGFDGVPFLAQRLDDGGEDEPLNVGAGRVVRP